LEDNISINATPKKTKDLLSPGTAATPATALASPMPLLSPPKSPVPLQPNASLSRTLSRKSTMVTEAAKEHKKSYLLAGLSALAFGTANYFMSDLSMRCGPNGVYTECFGLFLSWALFHLFNLIKHKLAKNNHKPFFSKSSSPYFEEFLEDVAPLVEEESVQESVEVQLVQVAPEPAIPSPAENSEKFESIESEESDLERAPETKAKSSVVPESFHVMTWQRVSAPLSRCLVQIMIQYAILSCFTFAAKSGVNGGIISAIFSSSCIFTIIIFYFKYGHKISMVDAFGTVFILLCVLLIAFGGTGGQSDEVQKTEEQLKTERLNLILALALAIISGLTLSLNTVSIQYTIYTGFDLDQANYDGNLMLGIIFLPFMIYHRDKYSMGDVFVGTLVILFVTTGIILFSKAIQCGIAGPVQAIENSKTLVQTVLCIIFLGQIPTIMQISGLLTGMIGVISIVL